MFPRISIVTRGHKEYHYVQIVEAYLDSGRPKQGVVANIRRLDLMDNKLDDLVASLRKYFGNSSLFPTKSKDVPSSTRGTSGLRLTSHRPHWPCSSKDSGTSTGHHAPGI